MPFDFVKSLPGTDYWNVMLLDAMNPAKQKGIIPGNDQAYAGSEDPDQTAAQSDLGLRILQTSLLK